ncbi:unnamed protein product [Amoebophrya sp. A25]|nr:unnamed protein product [Amoebophrya sp. A25]|eukprot:GSA25T00006215001.1
MIEAEKVRFAASPRNIVERGVTRTTSRGTPGRSAAPGFSGDDERDACTADVDSILPHVSRASGSHRLAASGFLNNEASTSSSEIWADPVVSKDRLRSTGRTQQATREVPVGTSQNQNQEEHSQARSGANLPAGAEILLLSSKHNASKGSNQAAEPSPAIFMSSSMKKDSSVEGTERSRARGSRTSKVKHPDVADVDPYAAKRARLEEFAAEMEGLATRASRGDLSFLDIPQRDADLPPFVASRELQDAIRREKEGARRDTGQQASSREKATTTSVHSGGSTFVAGMLPDRGTRSINSMRARQQASQVARSNKSARDDRGHQQESSEISHTRTAHDEEERKKHLQSQGYENAEVASSPVFLVSALPEFLEQDSPAPKSLVSPEGSQFEDTTWEDGGTVSPGVLHADSGRDRHREAQQS